MRGFGFLRSILIGILIFYLLTYGVAFMFITIPIIIILIVSVVRMIINRVKTNKIQSRINKIYDYIKRDPSMLEEDKTNGLFKVEYENDILKYYVYDDGYLHVKYDVLEEKIVDEDNIIDVT